MAKIIKYYAFIDTETGDLTISSKASWFAWFETCGNHSCWDTAEEWFCDMERMGLLTEIR